MYMIVWIDGNGAAPMIKNINYAEALQLTAFARRHVKKLGYDNVRLKIVDVPEHGEVESHD